MTSFTLLTFTGGFFLVLLIVLVRNTPMRLVVYFLAATLIFSSFAAAERWDRLAYSHSRITVEHDVIVGVSGDFTMKVMGLGGRELYHAKVTVYYDNTLLLSGYTSKEGVFTFTPPLTGRYGYTVDQGRYYSVGGEFTVVNNTRYGT